MKRLSFPNWTSLILAAYRRKLGKDSKAKAGINVWSGDGGSVCVGHVYLNETMINTEKEGALKKFVEFNHIQPPAKLFRKEYGEYLANFLVNNISREIGRIDSRVSERDLYLFLLFNDQRRHLTEHFETLLEHQTELLLPFFDIELLKIIMSIDIDKCLYHRFYADWFDLFPQATRMSPWQTYPGHVPCPVKSEDDLSYQWGKKKKEQRGEFRLFLKCLEKLRTGSGMKRYINLNRTRIVLLLDVLGFRKAGYAYQFVLSVSRFLR